MESEPYYKLRYKKHRFPVLERMESFEGETEFQKWAKRTTYHGILDVVETEHQISRVIWIVILLFVSYMFTLQSCMHIYDYVNGDDWITVALKERPAEGLKFPFLVVCNLNKVSKEQLARNNVSLDVGSYVAQSSMPIPLDSVDWKTAERIKNAFLEDRKTRGNLTIQEWTDLISPTCESIFLSCQMGPTGTPGGEFDCCKYSRALYITDYGRCFVMRPPDEVLAQFPQKQKGVGTGLKIYLYTHRDDYAPITNLDDPDSGILLFIGHYPEYSVFNPPVALWPGSHSWVSMESEQDRMENGSLFDVVDPFSLQILQPTLPCTKNGSLNSLNVDFTLETCIDDCYAIQHFNVCGCYPLRCIKDDLEYCDPVTLDNCRRERDKWNSFGPDYDACVSSCQDPCTKDRIVLSSSSLEFPAPNLESGFVDLMKKLGRKYNKSTFDDLMIADVFFGKDTTQVDEKRTRMSMEDLISNIGGTLGVYAGMSIITVYQAFLYFLNGMAKLMHRRGVAVRKFSRQSVSSFRSRKSTTHSIVDGNALDYLSMSKNFHSAFVLNGQGLPSPTEMYVIDMPTPSTPHETRVSFLPDDVNIN